MYPAILLFVVHFWFQLLPVRAQMKKTQRAEIRSLTTNQLSAYFNSLWIYKTTGRQDKRGYLTTYDALVAHHAIATTNSTGDKCHCWGGFIIWHAVYIRELEIALQSIDPSVSVPYWDWTIDSSMSDPRNSVIFSNTYFGGSSDTNVVNSGPLVGWNVSKTPSSYGYTNYNKNTGYMRSSYNNNTNPSITRYLGNGEAGTLPTSSQYSTCVASTSYSNFDNCVWGTVGTQVQSFVHAHVHYWVGGEWTSASGTSIGDIWDVATSPNDPLFFSHHANLDRMYYDYRKTTGDALSTVGDPCGDYYGEEITYPQPYGHNLNDTLLPYFYAFRTVKEIETLGPLSIREACEYLQTNNYVVEYLSPTPTTSPTLSPADVTTSPTLSPTPTKSPSTVKKTRAPVGYSASYNTLKPVEERTSKPVEEQGLNPVDDSSTKKINRKLSESQIFTPTHGPSQKILHSTIPVMETKIQSSSTSVSIQSLKRRLYQIYIDFFNTSRYDPK